jgi:uncharacterized membrane protein YheB (UPF0754 family)
VAKLTHAPPVLHSGVVGWGTNWVALKMTFYPLEFWPVKVWQPEDQPMGLFGWQGIIPAKAATMAADFTDMLRCAACPRMNLYVPTALC